MGPHQGKQHAVRGAAKTSQNQRAIRDATQRDGAGGNVLFPPLTRPGLFDARYRYHSGNAPLGDPQNTRGSGMPERNSASSDQPSAVSGRKNDPS
jgi:hypothetical protein